MQYNYKVWIKYQLSITAIYNKVLSNKTGWWTKINHI